MNTDLMFSSKTDLWSTPQATFDALNVEFNFQLDVCATEENAKCGKFYTAKENGLEQPWEGSCWMNPPYGKTIGQWVKKAYESAQGGGQPLFAFFQQEQIPSGGMTTA